MKKITLFTVILTMLFTVSQAQRKKPSTSLVVSVGTNQFMGDLGGGGKDAAHFFGLRDIDLTGTRPSWQVAYRYKFAGRKKEFLQYFSVRANLSYAFLSGKDSRTVSIGRQSRNLSFIANTYSMSGQLEYYFIPEKARPRYAFSSLKGSRNISAYLFLGMGGLYYNPKARLDDGKFTALQPLGTEGQLMPEFEYESYYAIEEGSLEHEMLTTSKPYLRFAAFIALGIGMKYDINRQWAIGLELSNRYTSSDYLDDVHDRYFNYENFNSTDLSLGFGDRHLTYTSDAVGGDADNYNSGKIMRGNPDYNDAYILTMVTIHYKLKSGNSRKSRPKFGS